MNFNLERQRGWCSVINLDFFQLRCDDQMKTQHTSHKELEKLHLIATHDTFCKQIPFLFYYKLIAKLRKKLEIILETTALILSSLHTSFGCDASEGFDGKQASKDKYLPSLFFSFLGTMTIITRIYVTCQVRSDAHFILHCQSFSKTSDRKSITLILMLF